MTPRVEVMHTQSTSSDGYSIIARFEAPYWTMIDWIDNLSDADDVVKAYLDDPAFTCRRINSCRGMQLFNPHMLPAEWPDDEEKQVETSEREGRIELYEKAFNELRSQYYAAETDTPEEHMTDIAGAMLNAVMSIMKKE